MISALRFPQGPEFPLLRKCLMAMAIRFPLAIGKDILVREVLLSPFCCKQYVEPKALGTC